MNGNYKQVIIEIEPPVKSRNSGARWVCYGFIESTLGNHRQNSSWDFWHKADAIKFYNRVSEIIKHKGRFERAEWGYVGDYQPA